MTEKCWVAEHPAYIRSKHVRSTAVHLKCPYIFKGSCLSNAPAMNPSLAWLTWKPSSNGGFSSSLTYLDAASGMQTIALALVFVSRLSTQTRIVMAVDKYSNVLFICPVAQNKWERTKHREKALPRNLHSNISKSEQSYLPCEPTWTARDSEKRSDMRQQLDGCPKNVCTQQKMIMIFSDFSVIIIVTIFLFMVKLHNHLTLHRLFSDLTSLHQQYQV